MQEVRDDGAEALARAGWRAGEGMTARSNGAWQTDLCRSYAERCLTLWLTHPAIR
jgi:hypothetical protein